MLDLLEIIYRSTLGVLGESMSAARQDLDLSELRMGKGKVPLIPARVSGKAAPERPESYKALLDAAIKVANGPDCARVAGNYLNPDNPEGLPYAFHIAKVTQTDALVRDVPEPEYLWNRPKAPVHYAEVKIGERGEFGVAYIDDSVSDFFEGLLGTHEFLFRGSKLGKSHLGTGNSIDRYHGITRTHLSMPVLVGGENMATYQLYQDENDKPVYLRLAIAGPLGKSAEKNSLVAESLCGFVAATGVFWQAWQDSFDLKEFDKYAHAAFSGRR